MTILPGSLDYLYYNGVLDYIPYEAYDMSPIVSRNQNQRVINGNQQPSMYPTQIQTQPMIQNSIPSYGMQGNMGLSSGINTYNSSNTLEYIDYARQGSLYNNNFPDMYVGNTYSQPLTGIRNSQPQQPNSIKDTITTTTKNISNKFSGMSQTGKGLIGLGAIILTGIMIVKGGKKGKVKKGPAKNKSFWSKFNPIKWFKKEVPPEPKEPPKTFWQKLGFGKKK